MWTHYNVAMIMSAAVKTRLFESFIGKSPTYGPCCGLKFISNLRIPSAARPPCAASRVMKTLRFSPTSHTGCIISKREQNVKMVWCEEDHKHCEQIQQGCCPTHRNILKHKRCTVSHLRWRIKFKSWRFAVCCRVSFHLVLIILSCE